MDFDIVIGLEIHSQLFTESKMFCSCSSNYQNASPNTVVCEICMGMPGVLPVINKRALELVIKTGLALNCEISRYTKFDRKNYPYPDLMKGYQISQYDQPIATNGKLLVNVDGYEKKVGITRVHLEEDVAKLFHRNEPNGQRFSLLDINRAGVPLMEIVSDPDMSTATEARSYLTTIHSILRYLGVSTANMEDGSFRCDANISIRRKGSAKLGSKVEVKNMNSFRSVYNALEYEVDRQVTMVQKGKRIIQETRGWEEDKEVTVSQRSKEYASDYRYFADPDLPPLVIDPDWVKMISGNITELPHVKKARFINEYELSEYNATLLTSSKVNAEYFESVMQVTPKCYQNIGEFAKSVCNWILGEFTRLINKHGSSIEHTKVKPKHIVDLLNLINDGTLSNSMAKEVFEKMFNTGKSPSNIAEEQDMEQITSDTAIRPIVEKIIDDNPKPVTDFLNGKETAFKFLVGQVMKVTRGRADPKLVAEIVKVKLGSIR